METHGLTPTKNPTVTFLGAARTVSGSMHLVSVGNQRVLLDCGLYLGHKPEFKLRNRVFPFDPRKLNAMVLTHAHIDHCGNVPTLVKQGFSGPIFCTAATRDLLDVMLMDSARIQEVENSPIPPKPWNTPLYDLNDARRTIDQCEVISYDLPTMINDQVELTLIDAGHILGSAMIKLRVQANSIERTLVYTGDLGRQNIPFLFPPAKVPVCDLLISESTYGGRYHQSLDSLAEQMAQAIHRAVAQGGKVLIPAFSLGRAQIVVHYMQKWVHDGLIPPLPMFVDSPLVADIIDVYQEHRDVLPKDCDLIFENSDATNSSQLRYIRSWNESRELTERSDPCIIIASGGMLDAGRALYHLQQYIDDPRCSIALVSYQTPGSLGFRLMERGPAVYFLGKMWNKWAHVVGLSGFSGHADHNDFIDALGPIAHTTKSVRLVHGEVESATKLAESLRELGFPDVSIPERDETILF